MSSTPKISQRNGVVLASDLLGFTRFVEANDDPATIGLLDRFYRAAEAAIQPQGTIIKFIGDALLAHFPDGNAEKALAAARKLLALELPLPMAIGLDFGAYGEAKIGLNGAGDIFGKPVNGAFILAKEAGIRASKAFLDQLGDDKRASWSSNTDASFYIES